MKPLSLRPATRADGAAIAAIYETHVRDSAVSFETETPTAVAIGNRIALADDRYPWLVCTDGPAVVGYAYASQHGGRAAFAWSVDVAIYIDARFHRRSVGRALYRALFDLLRRQGFVTAMAAITSANESSCDFHTAMGFQLVGQFQNVGYKLGAWHGVKWFQLQLLPPPAVPAPPLKLCELSNADRHASLVIGDRILATAAGNT